MNLSEGSNRTWLCTVVFMDLVGFSRTSVDRQLQAKQRLNEMITESIRGVEESSRVLLDTGDGTAICFLGDPEEAFLSALALRRTLNKAYSEMKDVIEVRMGINLGPIKLVRDLNGNINAIGDGINDAQRIMSFAGAQDLFVSRSFYDVVGRISEDINRMFTFVGIRKDKHVREHAVYAVGSRPTSGDTSSINEPVPSVEALSPPSLATSHPIAEWSLSDTTEGAIAAELARYIGPFARVLVAKRSKEASSVEEFLLKLGTEIDQVSDRVAFLAKARRLARED